jgi:hypothetical protein
MTVLTNNTPDHLTIIEPKFNVPAFALEDLTIHEVSLAESIRTPGLQTTVKAHSYLHNMPNKNHEVWKNAIGEIKFTRPMLEKFGLPHEMDIRQRVYRLSDRKLINNSTEEFLIHMCDDTLLNDARSLVSQSWKCERPSEVVKHVLQQCAGATQLNIEDADPARDYIAENIHPFQVVAQQGDVALASGNDPSFVHFMTYENYGTHHFRSLYKMTRQSPVMKLQYTEVGEAKGGGPNAKGYGGYKNPYAIMTYNFPCDFDLLSDLLNGIDVNGNEISSITVINPLSKEVSLMGNPALGCGIGGGVYRYGYTNMNTAPQQDSCNIDTESWLLKRQARMNLLEQDKIALRLTVPWCPIYNVGKVIYIRLPNKGDPDKGTMLYGSGEYLITALVHTIKRGGFSTITMDCVAVTTGQGIV